MFKILILIREGGEQNYTLTSQVVEFDTIEKAREAIICLTSYGATYLVRRFAAINITAIPMYNDAS